MSTRSPMNKRSQSGEVTGMARKSAASAKPARAAASSVRVVPSTSKGRRAAAERGENLDGLSKEEKKARKREIRSQEDRVYEASQAIMKADPDYKKYHKVWWVLLGVGLVAIALVWVSLTILQQSGDANESAGVLQMVGLVIAYGAIIAAFVFDFVKIRPIRNQARTIAEGLSKSKLNSVLEKAAAEEDAKRLAREEKKAARKKK